MVSLKKYIIKWLKILQTPIVKEFFVFHISQLNTPYYRDKYDLLSPSFVPLDSVSQSMYN